MKTMSAILAVTILIGSGAMARAGVVIDEQVTTTRGSEPPMVQTRQLFVQGHQEKMVSEHNSFVIDLDRGTMMLIDPKQKAYAEMPFPPQSQPSNPQQLGLNFQKTGKSSTVLNYGCEEYAGGSQSAMAAVKTTGCFSTSAPGAAEFTEFTKAMGAKLNEVHSVSGKVPSGIPLTMDSTRTVNTGFTMPGLSPEQTARLKQMLAKQGPQMTRTVVTKIATRSLPADTFTAPAGYERRDMAQPSGGAPASATVPPSGAKSPE
ncbi:MAG TPA: hypothetical protein VKT27_10715 [Candidatus Binataceae bacterium]|nr:hypothetical protein [Candidatus Binataceae bacterium]